MRWLKKNGQKGAVIVLTAFLLPLLIALTGLTVDFGNAYVHHAQLQNATDAAALAGANAYYRNQENTKKHPKADKEATRYISGDKNNLSESAIAMLSGEPTYQAKTKDDVTYYHVKATQEVPTTFLRYFLKSKDTITVQADSTAAISQTSSGDMNQLFVFIKKISITNAIENPDNFDIKGQIRTTFDGNVCYTDDNSDHDHYSTQTDKLKYLFTEQARKDGLSVNDAIKNNNPSNEKKRYVSQMTKTTYDFDALWNAVSSHVNPSERIKNQDVDESVFDNKKYVTFMTTSENPQVRNITVKITKPIAGDKNTPVYMLIAPDNQGLDVLNVELNADTGRPLIICLAPDNTKGLNNSSKIHINLNGHTFRGIIYAKNMDDEGVLINANNGVFQGSIMAKTLNLQGGTGTYRYEYFDGASPTGKSTGSSGGKNGNGTLKISLASPEGINWD